VSAQTMSQGRLLAILERGDPVPVLARQDMRLVADALAGQSPRLTSLRSQSYAAAHRAIAVPATASSEAGESVQQVAVTEAGASQRSVAWPVTPW
jgi:hypothetical protein